MVKELQSIHAQNFTQASKSIGKYQKKYKKEYDQRNKTKKRKLKVGDKVQYQRYASKKPKSKLSLSRWSPFRSYYLILKILPVLNGFVIEQLLY